MLGVAAPAGTTATIAAAAVTTTTATAATTTDTVIAETNPRTFLIIELMRRAAHDMLRDNFAAGAGLAPRRRLRVQVLPLMALRGQTDLYLCFFLWDDDTRFFN